MSVCSQSNSPVASIFGGKHYNGVRSPARSRLERGLDVSAYRQVSLRLDVRLGSPSNYRAAALGLRSVEIARGRNRSLGNIGPSHRSASERLIR